MIFDDDLKDNEFDFSISPNDYEYPKCLSNDLILRLTDACLEHGEIRFIGEMTKGDYMRIRFAYRRNGRIWQPIYFDDLQEMFENINSDDILNCIQYE